MQQVRQNSYPSIQGSQHINQPLYLALLKYFFEIYYCTWLEIFSVGFLLTKLFMIPVSVLLLYQSIESASFFFFSARQRERKQEIRGSNKKREYFGLGKNKTLLGMGCV